MTDDEQYEASIREKWGEEYVENVPQTFEAWILELIEGE